MSSSLVEKYALLPDEIDRRSLEAVEASLPHLDGLSPDERYVACRIVRAEGDPEIARSVGFSPGAVDLGVGAIRSGAEIVTDVRMVEMGISKALLARCRVATRCEIDTPETATLAQSEGSTRSVAAMRRLEPYLDGAVAAVGNAPTALAGASGLGARRQGTSRADYRYAGGIHCLRRVQRRVGQDRHSLYCGMGPPRWKLGRSRYGERIIGLGVAGRVAMTNSPGVDSGGRWGLVLLAHGSQRGATRDECSCGWRELSTPAWCLHCPSTPDGLRQAARRVQDLLGVDNEQIVLSCLEFIQPFPDEAVKLLYRRGFQKVVVMPFLLGSGKHATMELDEFLDDVRGQLPGMELRLADGLGADPRLAELVAQRVRGLEGGAATNGGLPKGVLLVKAGTKTQYDDCIWLEELGGMVEKTPGLGLRR